MRNKSTIVFCLLTACTSDPSVYAPITGGGTSGGDDGCIAMNGVHCDGDGTAPTMSGSGGFSGSGGSGDPDGTTVADSTDSGLDTTGGDDSTMLGTSGDSTTDDGGGSGSSDGGNMCASNKIWDCSMMAAVRWIGPQGQVFYYSQDNKLCIHDSNIAMFGAQTEFLEVCGPPTGGSPPADACMAACEAAEPADLGLPDTFPVGGVDYLPEVLCLHHGDPWPAAWNAVSWADYDGTCTFPDPTADAYVTGTDCDGEECEMAQARCSDYAGHNASNTITHGKIEATIDYNWVQDMFSHSELFMACDTGRYFFAPWDSVSDPEKDVPGDGLHSHFIGIKSLTLLKKLGFEEGDKELRLQAFDDRGDRIGSSYDVRNFLEAAVAYAALIKVEDTMRVVADVRTSGGSAKTIWITVLKQ